jgi:hypothetical protein
VKAYWGSGGTDPLILDLGTRWRWMVSFTPRPLYLQRKSPWYPLERRLGGPQSRSGRGGEEKNSQPLPGFEPPIIQPVVQRYTTELSRLHYRWYEIKYYERVVSSVGFNEAEGFIRNAERHTGFVRRHLLVEWGQWIKKGKRTKEIIKNY